ncbi:MAG TPA: hypothetical protein VLD84_11230 [Nitrososphaeraceae archaeon]|nr:hypothetical protein [Nitrososphaeraceae archaeon]
MSYTSQGLLSKVSADPLEISNDQVKDAYLMYVKLKINQGQSQGQGQGGPPSGCQPELGQLEKEDLQSDNALCNPGLENMKNKLATDQLDDNLVSQLSKNIDKKETILKDKLEKLRERMEKAISEEEEKQPIPPDEQKKVDDEDKKTTETHKSISGDNCRGGNVLSGASNEEDLKVLADCQEAVGDVMHTKKMDDGDYKFLLKLDDKYDFLINDKNNEKTDGLLVVEVVPDDQHIDNIVLPESGDKVHIWGAWVTDKPKGWHEIHPTWKVTKE